MVKHFATLPVLVERVKACLMQSQGIQEYAQAKRGSGPRYDHEVLACAGLGLIQEVDIDGNDDSPGCLNLLAKKDSRSGCKK